jgi:hypothetical protein
VDGRQGAIDAAVSGMPASAFGPFGKWASRMGIAYFCEQWPTPSGNTPLAAGPLPNVPVLLISGGYDLRTPTANARAVAQLFPQGHLLVVPGVGHSVLTGFSNCALTSTRDWILGNSIPSTCPRVPTLVKVVGPFAKRATRAATLALAGRSIREASATWLDALFASQPLVLRGPYGGTVVPLRSQLGFTVTKYSLAPGIAITGKLLASAKSFPLGISGTIRVSGAASLAGTLKVTAKKISGTLGGRKVSATY